MCHSSLLWKCSEILSYNYLLSVIFLDAKREKSKLEGTLVQWREYKEEHEQLCDWLQQMDVHVKAQKTALLSTLQEKQKQVEDIQVISFVEGFAVSSRSFNNYFFPALLFFKLY